MDVFYERSLIALTKLLCDKGVITEEELTEYLSEVNEVINRGAMAVVRCTRGDVE